MNELSRNQTQAYSSTDLEKKIKHIPDVKMVINLLIENHLEAWKSLPEDVRELMISAPEKFKFLIEDKNYPPKIIYNGIAFSYSNYVSHPNHWLLDSIL